MIIGNTKDLKNKIISNPLTKGVSFKVLVSPEEGWDGYVMRVFELEPGGFTPKH